MKDFCHKRHFFDIDVNSACSTAKPLLTVCVVKRQRKNARKSPSSADTRKVNQRMPKGLQPSRVAGQFFCFAFYLSLMSALLPQALDVNAYKFSNGLTDEALLKVFLFERAFLHNHAATAQRLACLADFAPVPDKPVMRVTPLFTRNNFFQLLFRS